MALIKCVNCGQEYSNKVDTCPHCGFKPSLFVCPECGTLILGDAVTCVKCGAPVTKEELVPAKKEQINHFYLTCVDKVPKAECAQDYRALEKSFDFLGDFESSKEFKQKCKELGDVCTENERHLDEYKSELAKIESCDNCKDLKIILDNLDKYNDCPEVEENRKICFEKWEKQAYEEACVNKNKSEALKMFEQLGEYADSKDKAKSLAVEIENKKAQNKKRIITIGTIVIVAIAVIAIVSKVIIPRSNYKKGVEAYNTKKYSEAIKYLENADNIEDSAVLLKECNYYCGMECVENKDYQEAVSYLSNAKEYKDAEIALNYSEGQVDFAAENYEAAYDKFEISKDYKDSKSMLNACNLYIGKALFDSGDYTESKKYLEKVPSGYSYNGQKASKYLDVINKNWSLLKLEGTYKKTGSYMEVKSTHKSTGSWNNWYWDKNDLSGELTLKCKLLENGKVRLTGTAKFWIVTEYSSLSSIVDDSQQYKTVAIDEEISSLPNGLTIADYTKMTVSGDSVKINYYKTESNKDVYFNYMYRTDMTFKK